MDVDESSTGELLLNSELGVEVESNSPYQLEALQVDVLVDCVEATVVRLVEAVVVGLGVDKSGAGSVISLVDVVAVIVEGRAVVVSGFVVVVVVGALVVVVVVVVGLVVVVVVVLVVVVVVLVVVVVEAGRDSHRHVSGLKANPSKHASAHSKGVVKQKLFSHKSNCAEFP